MHVSHTIASWRDRRNAFSRSVIGFVPTMGALHRGHASLVKRCRRENETVVVSIFVNPSQFNDPKDLDRYPRVLERDLALLDSLGADDVFAPDVLELYPHGYRFRVDQTGPANVMEGAHRPGFLPGVMTIVLKLLNVIRPSRAYFGEKDYQQLRTITEMVEDLFIPTEIIPCPTVREDTGLAESSRNMLLTPAGRLKAASLFRALTASASADDAKAILESEGFAIDYVEEHWGRRFAAVFLEGVRLIDNVPLP